LSTNPVEPVQSSDTHFLWAMNGANMAPDRRLDIARPVSRLDVVFVVTDETNGGTAAAARFAPDAGLAVE
jgi:hypothetical protein